MRRVTQILRYPESKEVLGVERIAAVPDRGYRLIFNIGPDAMNSIPHLHLHVLGGQPLKGHFALT